MAWKRPHLKELTEMHHFHYSNNICEDNICAHRRQLLWREAGQPRASAPGPGVLSSLQLFATSAKTNLRQAPPLSEKTCGVRVRHTTPTTKDPPSLGNSGLQTIIRQQRKQKHTNPFHPRLVNLLSSTGRAQTPTILRCDVGSNPAGGSIPIPVLFYSSEHHSYECEIKVRCRFGSSLVAYLQLGLTTRNKKAEQPSHYFFLESNVRQTDKQTNRRLNQEE